ncbi:hypothetical protein J3A83DRAFT_4373985 [Scleroderma citrinum]
MPAQFIDTLANQFGFGDSEQDLQHNLHGFAKHNTQQLLTDLQIWLEVTFSLTPEQKANVHIMAGDAIFDPSCITFMTMHFDVEAKIQHSMKELKFLNIYGNPAHEKILLGTLNVSAQVFVIHFRSCSKTVSLAMANAHYPTSSLKVHPVTDFYLCFPFPYVTSYKSNRLFKDFP